MPVIDFAIVTGLTEEFEVLRALFPRFQELSENADIWYRTRIKSKTGANYEIVAAFQNDMGPFDALHLTGRIIERWDPAYILLVGIAGSFQKDIKLGDVVVGQQVFYYDPGKATGRGIRYRPQGYPCSTVLVRQLEAIQLDKKVFHAWQQKARKSAARKAKQALENKQARTGAAKALLAHAPTIHFGTVASGSLVIADKKKQRELLTLHGKIIGTEMEGAGVMHATFREELPTPAIVVKSISDAADKNKDREDTKGYWRDLAKENPVRLVLELIRRGGIRPLRTDQFELDPTPGSPAEARKMIPEVSSPGVSYLAFPRLVLPRGPLTDLQVGIEIFGQESPLPVIKGVIQYQTPRGERKTMTWEGDQTRLSLRKPMLAEPVGIYLQLGGTPVRIAFAVSSPSDEQKTEWVPHPE